MKAHHSFKNELNKLLSFHKSTFYSFELTEETLRVRGRKKKDFENLGLEIKKPQLYKSNRRRRQFNRKNLNELVFVRGISALEVFLIDLIRDIFMETKDPFKKQDVIVQFTQAELLSIKSPASIFNKVINKECRKLSSGGYSDIVKYYKKHFDVDLSSYTPGKAKMEEYHDRRHILVHRLGKTDQQFRDKYKTIKSRIEINESYLFDCFEDFLNFSELVSNQVKYRLENSLKSNPSQVVKTETKAKITIELLKGKHDCFEPNFEFWAGDEFCMFGNILESKKQIDKNQFTIIISGKQRQIISYSRIIRQQINSKNIKAKFEKVNKGKTQILHPPRFLDEELITKIKEKLPEQPWETGIHKKVASELNVSNKLVSIAIQQLIATGVFKQQWNGKLTEVEPKNTAQENGS